MFIVLGGFCNLQFTVVQQNLKDGNQLKTNAVNFLVRHQEYDFLCYTET